MCDPLSKAECVPAFMRESERGPFCRRLRQELFCRVVPIDGSRGWVFVTAFERPLKSVWPMHWIRWYDCVSCAFRSFSEDEKESRIKGWRRKRRRSRHFCPQCGQLTGVSAQSVVAPFEENFRTAGVLVPANAGVPRILVVPCGRFGRKSR